MEYTKIISLKFTNSEYIKLQDLVRNNHKNRSEFIRERIFGIENKREIPLGYESLPEDFYQSEAWIMRSIEILKRDKWKCQLQGSECLEIGNIVHHIRSAKGNPRICLDPKNLVCACKKCHNKIFENYIKENEK